MCPLFPVRVAAIGQVSQVSQVSQAANHSCLPILIRPSNLEAGTSHIPRLWPSLPPVPRRQSPSCRCVSTSPVPPPFATLDHHIPRNTRNCHQWYPCR